MPVYGKSVFADCPESQGIEKMLLQNKEYMILQKVEQVTIDTLADFWTAVISYQSEDNQVDRTVFLLKEEG